MILDRIRNLDYAILLCEDWERMRAFYRDTLGFSVYRGWDGWCEFRVGSTLLTLRRRGRPYDGPAAEGAAVQLAFRVAPAEVDTATTSSWPKASKSLSRRKTAATAI